MSKQRIVPHLWFDKEAKQAAEFYCTVFPASSVTSTVTVPGTPSGDCDVVSFTVWGHEFMAISAGPEFTLNPSVSFMVNFDPSRDEDAREKIDEVWKALSDGGKVFMPIDKYPFSERYGWIQDKFGVSWQLILTDPEGEERPTIIPSLLFVGDIYGKAEEASDFYLSVFNNSKRGELVRYPAGMEPDKEGAVMFTDFMLENQWFTAMDSALQHDFAFNEAISFIIKCEDQETIDYYWDKLSAVPAAEQCGWLKDRYGLSWQVVPAVMDTMMRDDNPDALSRVTQSFLSMKKFDIAELQRAYDGAGR
ncbi:VOC family protein [Marinimicrobium sp. ABcell2]|uniref:VOC family protein n=1 Tax=Marinimicrobium sp. ABcell2 TaxID=3069751 RepID=UPI0027AFEFD7|nr:VOC family protein [Marinimicrobium sp. ABcell2]MDQ2076931.1 VOC family protein [Marinimicrobium sp. ABcell2]